jgi:tetratricopeptide (TPR) repeat protein
LLDATWGAGYVSESKRFEKRFDDQFFLTSPEKFILKHLPVDPMWQLLPCPITLDIYKKEDNEIKKTLIRDENCFSFNDTIAMWVALSDVQQKVNSAERAFRFNPSNYEVTGFAYLNLAYELSQPIENIYKNKEYNKALEINRNLLMINKKALKLLKKSKTQQAKKAVSVCKENIKSLQTNIESLKKFLK